MKKFTAILFIFILILTIDVFSKNYAILISAGQATTDDEFSNSEYWYDLFLTYEDLIIKEGYSHEDIYVFYGDGNDFTATTYNRYKISYHGWTNPIVDYDNSYNTMNTQIALLYNIITEEDNLLIRWVVGHGGGSDPNGYPYDEDDYKAYIQNLNQYITETQLNTMFNQINNYNRRKIFGMTCFSGCLAKGNVSFNNDKTTIITSSDWNESSYPYSLPGESIHAQFNYVINSSLYGEDPLGTPYYADDNSDNIISLWELYEEADVSPIMSSTPQIGDDCPLADKIYIDEDIILTNASLSGSREYIADNIKAQNNLIIPNTANVIFAAKEKIILKHGFHAQYGCYFHAYIGDISCDDGNKIAANDNYTNTTEYYPKEDIEKIKPQSDQLFKCYPNPNNGNFQVDYELSENETGILEIFDMFGKNLFNYSLLGGNNTLSINASSLQEGIYFYRAIAGNKQIAADKIVVIK